MRLILLIVYIALSYVYPGELIPELAPYRITYLVGLVGLAICALWLLRSKPAPLHTWQLWLLVAFTLTLGVSRMIADRWLGAPVMAVQRFGPALAMFVLTVCAVDSIRKLSRVATAMVLLSLFLVVQCVAAYHAGYRADLFLLDRSVRDEEADDANSDDGDEGGQMSPAENDFGDLAEGNQVIRIRGLGVMHDPNDLAVGLVVAVALLGAAWRPGARGRNICLVIVPGMFFCYGVYLTHSRGGTLALLVVLGGNFARRLSRRVTIAIMVVLLASVIVLDFAGGGRNLISPSDESASERIVAWTEGLEMLKSSPLFGVGYAQFLDYHTLTAHNAMVLCFAENGLIGYFFWLALLVMTLVQLHELTKHTGPEPLDRDIRRWAGSLQLATAGFLSAAFFLSRTYIPLLYLVVGLSVALIQIAREANRPLWSPSLPKFGAIVLGCEAASVLLIYVIVKLHLL